MSEETFNTSLRGLVIKYYADIAQLSFREEAYRHKFIQNLLKEYICSGSAQGDGSARIE